MIWGLVVATLLVGLSGLYAKHRSAQMDRREELRADFFKAAEALADSSDTPESVLDLIEFLADRLADRRAPYMLLYFLMHGDARRNAREPGEKVQRLHRDVAAMPAALQGQFGKLVAAGALAITFNSLLVGWLISRLALYQVNRRNPRHDDGTDDADLIMTGWACA
jgi:erythromycin esterase-like protein